MNSVPPKMFIQLLTFTFALFISIGTNEQNMNVDSLTNALHTKKHSPEKRIQLLSNLYHGTVRKDTSIAFSYIREMKLMTNSLTDSLSKSILYSSLGNCYNIKDSIANSLELYEKSIR